MIWCILVTITVFCYEKPQYEFPSAVKDLVDVDENYMICQWGARNLTIVVDIDSGYRATFIRYDGISLKMDIESDSILKWAFSELPKIKYLHFEEMKRRHYTDSVYLPFEIAYYDVSGSPVFYYNNWSIIPEKELADKLKSLKHCLTWKLWENFFKWMDSETKESQKRDFAQFNDIINMCEYPFHDQEDDNDNSYILDLSQEDIIDNMKAILDQHKYNRLTKAEALTIICYACHHSASYSILLATGEALVNNTQFFEFMVDISKSLPNKHHKEFNTFLQKCITEYGWYLIDSDTIDISCDILDIELPSLDSIISIRNSLTKAMKDHPVNYGATE